jgi:RNA polymerase sigma factor (sigma-70 family)
VSSVIAARASARGTSEGDVWRERAGRLYEELRAPARAMVRRAFRGAFSDDEIEDVYANAWLGTLRALAPRQAQLGDEEIRKYVLTAVAHQASKELRRRGRKPTAPLEKAGAVADGSASPDERVTQWEDSRVMRDLLASLPRRRRAVLMLRYGWGLEPAQVCELIKGLSPRAYRKEITRGIDDLADRLRTLERGDWCADREPILKSYAAGLADGEQRRQAEHHLAHCRHCSDFVRRLSGHLHDLGGGLALPGTLDAVDDGHLGLIDRLGNVVDRVRESLPSIPQRGDVTASDAVRQVAHSGGLRGGGAAGAGALTKLAGLSTVGKVAVACLTGGVAATCAATGVGPIGLPGLDRPQPVRAQHAGAAVTDRATGRPVDFVPPQAESEPSRDPHPPDPGVGTGGDASTDPPPPTTTTTPETTPVPTAPPAEAQWGVAPASSTDSSSAGPSESSTQSRTSSAEQEFGP